MVDFHYFIFVINADAAVFGVIVFLMSYIALRLVYRMWRRSKRCPHCGEVHATKHIAHIPEKTPPNTLWTLGLKTQASREPPCGIIHLFRPWKRQVKHPFLSLRTAD